MTDIATVQMPYQNLFAALAKSQGEMEKLIAGSIANVKSDKANYSYKYADLADVLKVAQKALSAHGLGVMQFPEVDYQKDFTIVTVGATLFHSSGEFMVIPPLPLRIRANANAQEIGGAITYARRYQLQSVCGLAPDSDDDANEVSQKQAKTAQRKAEPEVTHRAPVEQLSPADELEKARKAFHAEVSATFPKDDIDAARHWLIESYTTKQTDKVRSSTNDLTLGEINELAVNLKTYRKALRDRWTKESAQPVTA